MPAYCEKSTVESAARVQSSKRRFTSADPLLLRYPSAGSGSTKGPTTVVEMLTRFSEFSRQNWSIPGYEDPSHCA
jgi:hypothetical protein